MFPVLNRDQGNLYRTIHTKESPLYSPGTKVFFNSTLQTSYFTLHTPITCKLYRLPDSDMRDRGFMVVKEKDGEVRTTNCNVKM